MNATKRRRALDAIERQRLGQRLAIRRAAERVGMSESNWRQLVAGQAVQGGQVVKRLARLDQVLDMAAAVGLVDEVAEIVGATREDIERARSHATISDPAEEYIMNSRHLSPTEKLLLIKTLQELRNSAENG